MGSIPSGSAVCALQLHMDRQDEHTTGTHDFGMPLEQQLRQDLEVELLTKAFVATAKDD